MMTLFETATLLEDNSTPIFQNITTLLARASSRHSKLCPRQVLGVRMGLYGVEILGLPDKNEPKHMLVILETDGCFADGIQVSTRCSIGKRTLRIEDYGKVAATFVDTHSNEAVRLVPSTEVRSKALFYAWDHQDRYQAQLIGYQFMPPDELFRVQKVHLKQSLQAILSEPGRRVNCNGCGEEIINQREIQIEKFHYCRSCLGLGYYVSLTER